MQRSAVIYKILLHGIKVSQEYVKNFIVLKKHEFTIKKSSFTQFALFAMV